MITRARQLSWKGYLLLPPSPFAGYRGVDRTPFDPVILESEIHISTETNNEDEGISALYPPGWRKRAYQLFENNRVNGAYEGISLLTNIQTAREIKEIIESHIGYHEIIGCEIYGLENNHLLKIPQGSNSLGFDIAYPGGDFYSAILNGLYINPDPFLLKEYFHLLNEHGLFRSAILLGDYLSHFRKQVPSEMESEFCIYKLHLVASS